MINSNVACISSLSTYLNGECYRYILNITGPETEPCGTHVVCGMLYFLSCFHKQGIIVGKFPAVPFEYKFPATAWSHGQVGFHVMALCDPSGRIFSVDLPDLLACHVHCCA